MKTQSGLVEHLKGDELDTPDLCGAELLGEEVSEKDTSAGLYYSQVVPVVALPVNTGHPQVQELY